MGDDVTYHFAMSIWQKLRAINIVHGAMGNLIQATIIHNLGAQFFLDFFRNNDKLKSHKDFADYQGWFIASSLIIVL